jgi:hypothetical protein
MAIEIVTSEIKDSDLPVKSLVIKEDGPFTKEELRFLAQERGIFLEKKKKVEF